MSSKKSPMATDAAARIQSNTAKTEGNVSSGSFAARAQSSAAANINQGITTHKGGK